MSTKTTSITPKKPVYTYSATSHKLLAIYPSVYNTAKSTNQGISNVSTFLNTKTRKGYKSCGGYIFSFKPITDFSPYKFSGTKKKVNQYTINGEFIKTFDSIREATKYVDGKSTGAISDACKGIRISAYGYKWGYTK